MLFPLCENIYSSKLFIHLFFRDLGQYIRDQLKNNFSSGDINSNASDKECERVYKSLKKLSENHYFNLYKRHSQSSATGFTTEQCNAVLSDEYLAHVNKKETNIFKRLIRK